jgi:hypothetical protein
VETAVKVGSVNTVIPVLDKIRHARIIQDFADVCMVAGVQGKYLHESTVDYCGLGEVEWVPNFHKDRNDGVPGLVLQGVSHKQFSMRYNARGSLQMFIATSD